MDTWQVKRPFWWGLLLILDRDVPVVPEFGDSVVLTSPSGLAVKVLHAQDVDSTGLEDTEMIPPAQVEVHVLVGDQPHQDAPFCGEIDVPSGFLTVGDAAETVALEIGPGRWAVQVQCSPREFAETVRVWLQHI